MLDRRARLQAESMAAAVDWLSEFEAFRGTKFDQLDDVLADLQSNDHNEGTEP